MWKGSYLEAMLVCLTNIVLWVFLELQHVVLRLRQVPVYTQPLKNNTVNKILATLKKQRNIYYQEKKLLLVMRIHEKLFLQSLYSILKIFSPDFSPTLPVKFWFLPYTVLSIFWHIANWSYFFAVDFSQTNPKANITKL